MPAGPALGADERRHVLEHLQTVAERASRRGPDGMLARSTASALTRVGNPEPMRRFITDQLRDETSEAANLNYWAFWTGELSEPQASDAFIDALPLNAWHGRRVARHLLDRLHGNIGFMELNIHSLWALIRIRSGMAADPALSGELEARIGRLPDENMVSAPARGELEAPSQA